MRPSPLQLAVILLAGALPAQSPNVRELTLTGPPLARGKAHGEQLRAEITTLHARWEQDVQATFHVPLRDFVTRFLAATQFDQAIAKETPDLLDEVRGIAEGAGLPFEQVLVWQLIDEIWASGPAVLREKCTAIGVDRRGDQPAIVAQNVDVPEWYHGFVTVLRVRDGDHEALVLTIPGVIGVCGLNDRGVAIACNTLIQLQPCRDGLPVACVVRGVLACQDQAQAVAFVQRIHHASGQCYTIGGGDVAHAYECSAGKVVRAESHAGAPFVVHTNHPFANDELNESARKRRVQLPRVAGCCPRLDAALATWTKTTQPDVAAVANLLASHGSEPGICNDATYACVVMTLGGKPELRVTAGRPDRGTATTLTFTR